MSISLFKRLAFKIMKSSLALALILGVAIALLQVYIDFRSQRAALDNSINEIFRVTSNAAGRAVHLLDNELAMEVVKGLQYYDYITEATIYDDQNRIMATFMRPTTLSSTLLISTLLAEANVKYNKDLIYSDGAYEGRISLVINKDIALAPFYERAITIFLTGIARNFSLALVLLLLYHFMLTRPLTEVARRFETIKNNREPGQRIEHIPQHRNNELSLIINAANEFIEESEEHRTSLERNEKQLRIILDSSPNHIFALDYSGNILFINACAAEFYAQDAKQLIGKNFFDAIYTLKQDESDAVRKKIDNIATDKLPLLNAQLTLTDAQGDSHIMQMSLVPFLCIDKTYVLIMASDITDRVKAEQRIENLAYFDALTGLPNRNMLISNVSRDLAQVKNNNTFGAILFIDLDDFKRINDTMGHSIGDEVLLKISRILKSQINQSQTLSRLGGDEFVFSLPNLPNSLDVARKYAREFAENLMHQISKPMRVDGKLYYIAASIGIVIYPDAADNTETLLRFADTAMYQAKKAGRGCYRFFEAAMAAEIDRAVILEAELNNAIKERQFTFYLQPIVDSKSRRVVSAEALVRWIHPERGLIQPVNFIDFLENTDMINEVDQLVLEEVCIFLRELRTHDTLPPGFRIAVNISARELHRHDFAQQIETILERHDIPGSCIELEITEGAALLRLDEVVEKIRVLQSLGITFALDDFGTGYSSLSYLKRLPINKLKIDKSFIKDLTVDAQDEALATSIIAIAKTFNLVVVAEGVETDAQAAWLNQYEDILYQGYFFDKPMPKDVFQHTYLLADTSQTK